MKIGIFTDPHYALAECLNVTRRPNLSLDKLREACQSFADAHVDAIVCLGDWISVYDTKDTIALRLKEMAEVVRATGLPVYSCMGNHDREIFTKEEFSALTGATIAPCLVQTPSDPSSTLILLDANFKRDGSEWPDHYLDWTQTCIPESQVIWLKEQIQNFKGLRLTIGTHQVMDPSLKTDSHTSEGHPISEGPAHVIENEKEIREILESSGIVSLVLQGHYHWGQETIINHIRYRTLKAMCEGTENMFYVMEI